MLSLELKIYHLACKKEEWMQAVYALELTTHEHTFFRLPQLFCYFSLLFSIISMLAYITNVVHLKFFPCAMDIFLLFTLGLIFNSLVGSIFCHCFFHQSLLFYHPCESWFRWPVKRLICKSFASLLTYMIIPPGESINHLIMNLCHVKNSRFLCFMSDLLYFLIFGRLMYHIFIPSYEKY